MRINFKDLTSSVDVSGLMLSLSGIVLGVLFAVAEYHVAWSTALALIMTVVPFHIYMLTSGRLWLFASVAGAVLTVYLSYSSLFSLESFLLLLFAYFIIRLAKGVGDKGKISEALLTCFLKGPVALVGAYFVCTHSFPYWIFLLPSLSVGLLCVAADGASGRYAKHLPAILIIIGVLLMLAFALMRIFSPMHFIFIAIIPVFMFFIFRTYMKKEQPYDMNRSALAFCTFAFAVLTGIGFTGHLF